MSSSVGYDYSYVDLEAQACRRLRAEIAGYAARSRVLSAQARQMRGAGHGTSAGQLGKPRAGAGSSELSAVAASYRDQLESAEREIAGIAAARWAGLLAAPGGSGPAERLSATEELARSRAGALVRESATTGPRPGAAQLAAADQLIAAELGRCEGSDLEALHLMRAEISSATTARQARMAFAELEIAVGDSIRRRRRADEIAQVRANLLELAEDAPPEERTRLRAMIEESPDPGGLSAEVGQAVARADLRRARDAVAAAAADALREIGCEVGEDFATLLTGSSEGVVAFGEDWAAGYGLLVRLPPGAGRVMAAVVRREGTASGADEAVQRQFCERGLPGWAGGLRDSGIALTEEHRVEPGSLPVAAIPEQQWPARPGTVKQAAARRPRSAARPAAARERQHDR